ncbi:hypothetical protein MTO96_007497 [Rhipicephalus appendiculatus]
MNEPAEFTGSASCQQNDVSCQVCPQSRWEYPPYVPVTYRTEEGNATQLHNGTLCMNAAFGERLRYRHYDVHNIYGWSHSMATQWALTDLIGDRTLVISESTYPSTGRYAGHLVELPDFGEWSGLRRAIVAVLEFNMFGIPYRVSLSGGTVVRPLFFEFPLDKATYTLDEQFMWGSSILFSPILDEGLTTHSYYLPPDVWFDFTSGLRKDGSIEMMSRSVTENSTLLVHVRGGQNLLRVSISHFGNGTRQNATVRNIVFFDVDTAPSRVTMNKNGVAQNSVIHNSTTKSLTVTVNLQLRSLNSMATEAVLQLY